MADLLVIRRGRTLEQVEVELRDFDHPTIYYAVHTCWWTHNRAHLSKLSNSLPADPRGSVLMMTHGDLASALRFIETARANASHYGKHGLRAFLAAHHENSFNRKTGLPWSERTWSHYNDAIDRLP